VGDGEQMWWLVRRVGVLCTDTILGHKWGQEKLLEGLERLGPEESGEEGGGAGVSGICVCVCVQELLGLRGARKGRRGLRIRGFGEAGR
jgi:hypothetical protein